MLQHKSIVKTLSDTGAYAYEDFLRVVVCIQISGRYVNFKTRLISEIRNLLHSRALLASKYMLWTWRNNLINLLAQILRQLNLWFTTYIFVHFDTWKVIFDLKKNSLYLNISIVYIGNTLKMIGQAKNNWIY